MSMTPRMLLVYRNETVCVEANMKEDRAQTRTFMVDLGEEKWLIQSVSMANIHQRLGRSGSRPEPYSHGTREAHAVIGGWYSGQLDVASLR